MVRSLEEQEFIEGFAREYRRAALNELLVKKHRNVAALTEGIVRRDIFVATPL